MESGAKKIDTMGKILMVDVCICFCMLACSVIVLDSLLLLHGTLRLYSV